MRLLSLEVKDFACVASAKVELGRGLNVLYGPNDLGKSTLAQALRAALLLQHSSNAAQDFVPWHADAQPTVVVVFETEAERLYRLTKRFGSPSLATLEASRDGQVWSMLAKSREVDERVRALLGWGIAAPGRSGPRGLPDAFLATVLLGGQSDVGKVLQQSLDHDTDPTGKARLTAALGALAEDPLFKRILGDAQAKVDEAFTGKGRAKRGRGSPFFLATEAVKEAKKELDRYRASQEQAEIAERTYREHREAYDGLVEAQAELQTRHRQLQGWAAQTKARAVKTAELAQAEQRAQAAQKAHAAVRELEATVARDKEQLQQLAEAVERARQAKERAVTELERCKEARDVLRSDEAGQKRALAISEQRQKRVELEGRVKELTHAADRAQELAQKEAALKEVRDKVAAAESAQKQAIALREGAAKRLQAAQVLLAALEQVERLFERDMHKGEVREREEASQRAQEARGVAQARREEASQLRGGLAADLPTVAQLDALQQLQHALQLAEAKVGVGLSMRVERRQPVALRAVVDGGAEVAAADGAAAGEAIELEAERSIELTLGDVAVVRVEGGAQDAREQAAALRTRWAAEGLPVLERAGQRELAELRKQVESAGQTLRAAKELEAEAARQEQAAQADEARAQGLDEQRERLAALEAQIAAYDLAALEALKGELGAVVALRSRRDEAKHEQDKARADEKTGEAAAQKAAVELAGLQSEAKGLEHALAPQAGARPGGGWGGEAERLRAEQREVDRAVGELQTAIDELEQQKGQELKGAEEAVQRAVGAVEQAKAAHMQADEAQRKAAQALASAEGELKQRRAHVAGVDLPAAEAAVQKAQDELARLPEPEELVGEEQVAAAEEAVKAAKERAEAKLDDVRKAEGALETVGGVVVRERVAEAKGALEAAEKKEQEVSLDYEAYRLLVETLREAENTEGAHLGRALAGPVGERFAQLTDARYGGVEVGPDLATQGVMVAGVLREAAKLSVGTHEQLATLLRLTIAEVLETMVLLDDQLTQTDPERTGRFRRILRDHAEKGQIVVLTCRPLDYVDADDLPDGEPTRDRAAGLVRTVDLGRVMRRGGPSRSERAHVSERAEEG